MDAPHFPLLVDGDLVETRDCIEVRSPWSGEVVGTCGKATRADLERAAGAAVRRFPAVRALPPFRRAEILVRIGDALEREGEAIARTIVREAGKPLKFARAEVERGVMTFRFGAEESRRIGGDVIPLDVHPRGEGRIAFTRRVPIGPVAAISPFNFPLNLVAHKAAPATAAGCPLVLKPASATPLTAGILARIYLEAEAPPGLFQYLPCDRETGDALVTDDRFRLLSFTGSTSVGWAMKAKAGRKPVVLELGGNAAAIVHDDADVDGAAKTLAAGAFGYAGQSCISVQRVFLQERIADEFTERFVAATAALVAGDPMDPRVDVGPLIDPANADRVLEWIGEAVRGGARKLCGGERSDNVVTPCVLDGVRPEMRVDCEEVFGPVAVLHRYGDFADALRAVNDSRFGLQAGIFTRDIARVLSAWDELEVGQVMVNESPTWRIDHMPYGGVKDSGLGREGVRYAIEHMTEIRMLGVRR